VAGGSTQDPKVPMFHPCLVLGDVGGALVFLEMAGKGNYSKV